MLHFTIAVLLRQTLSSDVGRTNITDRVTEARFLADRTNAVTDACSKANRQNLAWFWTLAKGREK